MIPNKPKMIAVFTMACIALLCSIATTYLYGLTFSHPRYWEGTISRMAWSNSALIEALVTEMSKQGAFPMETERLESIFSSVKNKLIIEVSREGNLVWTNINLNYLRSLQLRKIDLADGRILIVSKYEPPKWSFLFTRWLKNPRHWLEPSYDYVTLPFAWFFSIYLMAMAIIVLSYKSRYLEKDVLSIFKQIEDRYPR